MEERKVISGGDHPFFAAIYARLSVDSHSHKNESIETQIAIGEEFIRKYNEKIKENTQKNIKDSIQKSIKENIQESIKENIRESIQENNLDSIQENNLESFQKNIRENIQESIHNNIRRNMQHFENAKFDKNLTDNQGMQDTGYLKEIVLYGCYRDLGKSGTTFQREGFRRLMADIRSRKVNCVIVKDFSRFGRDYIETGNYIEKIFPMLGVRFISVTDGYDSLQPMGEPEHMGMQLKNLVNELYARDISYRVKTAKQAKKEQGGYTGGTPPYGYAIVREGGRRVLTPDPETAPILREIFEMYHREKNAGSIIRILYERRIHRPKDARKYAHAFCQPGETIRAWDYEAIKFILQNELYRAGEGMVPVTEALVEGEVFDEIQEHFRYNARRFRSVMVASDRNTGFVHEDRKSNVLQISDGQVPKRRDTYREGKVDGLKISDGQVPERRDTCREGKVDGLQISDGQIPERRDTCRDRKVDGRQTSEGWDASFDRRMNPILVCGECGAAMERVSSRRGGTYHCRNGGRIDQLACQHKYISVQEIVHMLGMLEKLQWWVAGISSADWDTCVRQALEEEMIRCRLEIVKIQNKGHLMLRELSIQYAKYRGGELPKEKFLSYKASQEKEKITLTIEKDAWKHRLQKWENRWRSDKIGENEQHRTYFVTGLKLFPGKRMEIYYNYQWYNSVTEGR